MKKISVNQERIYKLISFMFSFATTTVFTMNILYHIQIAKLSPLQLVLVGTCLEITCFCLEVPTGIIADRYSRKLSIILGFILVGCGFIIEGSIPCFIGIAIAQFVWGTGYTCVSGALDAWVVDETGKESLFISGAKNASIGKLLGIAASVGLAQISLNLPIICGGVSLILLSIILILFMTEKPYKKNAESVDKHYFSNMIKSIIQTIKSNHVLAILFVIALFFGLYSEGYDRLWGALIIQTKEFTNINDTYIYGAIAAIVAIIGFLAFNKIEKKAEETNINIINKILISLCIVIFVCLSCMTIFENEYIIAMLIVIIELSRSIISPFESMWLNSIITDNDKRATLLSLKGQVDSIGQIGSGLLMGSFSVFIPIRFIFVISAVVFSPVIFLYGYLKKCS